MTHSLCDTDVVDTLDQDEWLWLSRNPLTPNINVCNGARRERKNDKTNKCYKDMTWAPELATVTQIHLFACQTGASQDKAYSII